MSKMRLKIICVSALSFLMVFSLACTGTKVVTDYPDNDGTFVSYRDDSEEDDDSYSESENYKYDPVKIFGNYQTSFSEDVMEVVKTFMLSAYETETSVEFSPDLEIADYEIEAAWRIAQEMSPICISAEIKKTDERMYEIIYLPDYSANYSGTDSLLQLAELDYVSNQKEDFVEYVEDMLNTVISPKDDEAAKAYKIYKQLLLDFDLIEIEEKQGEYLSPIPDENGHVANSFIECVNNRKIHQNELIMLYAFLLEQIDIGSYEFYCEGEYVLQDCQWLNDDFFQKKGWIWNGIMVGTSTYHCDIVFDKYVFEDARAITPQIAVEPKYFGMSDSTRKKSWYFENNPESFLVSMPGTEISINTPCPSDLVIHEEE